MPSVSSSMRRGEPVAVAATTALSAAEMASRRSARRAFFTPLKMRAVARRTATASGCSGGSSSVARITRRQVARSAGSMPAGPGGSARRGWSTVSVTRQR